MCACAVGHIDVRRERHRVAGAVPHPRLGRRESAVRVVRRVHVRPGHGRQAVLRPNVLARRRRQRRRAGGGEAEAEEEAEQEQEEEEEGERADGGEQPPPAGTIRHSRQRRRR